MHLLLLVLRFYSSQFNVEPNKKTRILLKKIINKVLEFLQKKKLIRIIIPFVLILDFLKYFLKVSLCEILIPIHTSNIHTNASNFLILPMFNQIRYRKRVYLFVELA